MSDPFVRRRVSPESSLQPFTPSVSAVSSELRVSWCFTNRHLSSFCFFPPDRNSLPQQSVGCMTRSLVSTVETQRRNRFGNSVIEGEIRRQSLTHCSRKERLIRRTKSSFPFCLMSQNSLPSSSTSVPLTLSFSLVSHTSSSTLYSILHLIRLNEDHPLPSISPDTNDSIPLCYVSFSAGVTLNQIVTKDLFPHRQTTKAMREEGFRCVTQKWRPGKEE